MSDTLRAGERLAPGDQLDSAGGRAHLRFGDDGNLVLTADRDKGSVVRWQSDTAGLGGKECVLSADGSLSIKTLNDALVIWRSGITAPNVLSERLHDRPNPRELVRLHVGAAKLIVRDDENVVVTLGGRPVWATGTSIAGQMVAADPNKPFLLQPDGKLKPLDKSTVVKLGGPAGIVLVHPDQIRIWKIGTKFRLPQPLDVRAIQMCHDRLPPQGLTLPPRTVPVPPPQILADGSVGAGVARQPLASETEKLWDIGATLRIKFVEGGSAALRSRIRTVAETWLEFVNLHFDWVDKDASAHIKIRVNNDGQSYSAVGRDALWYWGDSHTMNFGWLTDGSSDVEVRRVVLHELGHALGFVHEHQSPAAGIAWDKTKVYEYYETTNGWDKGMVDHNVLTKYQATVTNYSAFDPDSIMLYAIPASLTLDGFQTNWNTQLSDPDKEYASDWYPQLPSPADAKATLRTGDGNDEIPIDVEYGVIAAETMEFNLHLGGGLTWWKAIEIPVGGGGYVALHVHDNIKDAAATIATSDLDRSRPVRFWKAKFLGVHTRLSFTWDVLFALPGGSRVNLSWIRD